MADDADDLSNLPWTILQGVQGIPNPVQPPAVSSLPYMIPYNDPAWQAANFVPVPSAPPQAVNNALLTSVNLTPWNGSAAADGGQSAQGPSSLNPSAVAYLLSNSYGQAQAAPAVPPPASIQGPYGGGVPQFQPISPPVDSQMPSNAALGFDPNGPGQWGAAMRHPLDAMTGNNLANQAVQTTKDQYPNDPGGWQNDEADAFRHAYWSYLMTRAFGAQEAQQFGDAHEISAPNPDPERYMDLNNNQVGRNLWQGDANADPIAIIKNAIKNGKLRTTPYRE